MEELENRRKAEAEAELKQADEKRKRDREEHRRLICAEFGKDAIERKKRTKDEEDGEEEVWGGGTDVEAEERGREPEDVVVGESSEEADPSIEGEWTSPVVGQEAEAELNPSSGAGLYPEVEEEEQQMLAGSSNNRMSPVVEEEAEEEFNPWGDMTPEEEGLFGAG